MPVAPPALLLALLLQVTDSRPSAAGAISGRVTEQATGRPLPRSVVTLAPADQSKRVEVVTDADGAYRFAGLEPGKYAVLASPDEHRSTHLRQWYDEADPAAPGGAPPRLNIELKPGEARTDVDIALTRALAIEGHISDPSGDPRGEVEIAVTRADGRAVYVRPVYSDDLGAYRVFDLPPGRYRVCAKPGRSFDDPPGPDAPKLARTCYPATPVEADAADVTLVSQDATGIDIRIQAIGGQSISGTVTDAAGGPADGAAVSASPLDAANSIGGSTRTRRGEFTIAGLVPGRYMIQASRGDVEPDQPITARMERGYATTNLGAADVIGISVTLSKPVNVSGTVRFDGAPAPARRTLHLAVSAYAPEDRMRGFFGMPRQSPVNDDLRFELTGLFRTPLAVVITGLPDGWVRKSVRYRDRDVTYAETDFGADPTATLEIVVTNRVARPAARVTDDRGTPVTSFRVVLLPSDPARWKFGFLVEPTDGQSSDGVVTLGPVLPGEYLVAALPTEDVVMLFRDRPRIEAVAAIATKVLLESGDTRTMDLHLVKLPDER